MHFLTCLLLALAPQLPAAAEPEISSVHMTVSLTQPGERVDVAIRYQLQLPAGTDAIPLHAIAFLDARPTEVRAFVDGQPVGAELSGSGGASLAGAVRLSSRRSQAGLADLELRYRVDGSARRNRGNLDVTVPVLFVTGRPSGSPEDFFAASVQVPAEHVIYELFPTVPRSVEHSAGGSSYTFALQAVPSMIRWHSSFGTPPLVPFELMVDLFTIAVLLLLSFLTYRVLRGA